MKFIDNGPGRAPVLELTRRNLEVLLQKLDDPDSKRTIMSAKGPHRLCAVHAVENDEHYSDREPGEMLVNGVIV